MKNIIKGSGIKLEFVNSNDQFSKLQEFAKTFNHSVETRKYPLIAMKENEKWFGYAQIVNAPVVFTAWHTEPTICSPRQVVEAFKILAGWAKVQHGGGMTAVPLDTKTFLPSVMQKLGFNKMNSELYEVSAE